MRFMVLALALLLAPGAAMAQTQPTVEGAQTFLEMTLPGIPIRFYYHDGDFQDGKVVGPVTSPERCESLIAGIDLKADSTLGANYIKDKYLLWDRIAGVTRSGLQITVKRIGSTEYFRFEMQTEDLAKRVATAMEFLRANCDRTASTGF